MRAYKAYGKQGHVTASTPKQAVTDYFERFPTSRKCDVIEGEYDGLFFIVKYGRSSTGEWPYSVKDVTKKQIDNLPDVSQ